MLSEEATATTSRTAWWLASFPASPLATVLAVNLLGEWRATRLDRAKV